MEAKCEIKEMLRLSQADVFKRWSVLPHNKRDTSPPALHFYLIILSPLQNILLELLIGENNVNNVADKIFWNNMKIKRFSCSFKLYNHFCIFLVFSEVNISVNLWTPLSVELYGCCTGVTRVTGINVHI